MTSMGTKVELTAHEDVARMILHIIDQMNGIPLQNVRTVF